MRMRSLVRFQLAPPSGRRDVVEQGVSRSPGTRAVLRRIRAGGVVGLDLQADGGTHVANTREVGGVRVVDYKSKGQINKRLHIALDA